MKFKPTELSRDKNKAFRLMFEAETEAMLLVNQTEMAKRTAIVG